MFVLQLVVLGARVASAQSLTSSPQTVTVSFGSPGSGSGYDHATIEVSFAFLVCSDELTLLYGVNWNTLSPGNSYIVDGQRVDASSYPSPKPTSIDLSAAIRRGSETIATMRDGTTMSSLGTGCISGQTRKIGLLSQYLPGKPTREQVQALLDSLDVAVQPTYVLTNLRIDETERAKKKQPQTPKPRTGTDTTPPAESVATATAATTTPKGRQADDAQTQAVDGVALWNKHLEEEATRAEQDRQRTEMAADMAGQLGGALMRQRAAEEERRERAKERHAAKWGPICANRKDPDLGEVTYFIQKGVHFTEASRYCSSGDYEGMDARQSRDAYHFTVTRPQKYRFILDSEQWNYSMYVRRPGDDKLLEVNQVGSEPMKLEADLQPGAHKLIVIRLPTAFQDPSASERAPYRLRIIADETCWMPSSQSLDGGVIRGAWSRSTCKVNGRPGVMYRVPASVNPRDLSFAITSRGSAPAVTVLAHDEGIHPKQEIVSTTDTTTASLHAAGDVDYYVLVSSTQDGDDAFELQTTGPTLPYEKHLRFHWRAATTFLFGTEDATMTSWKMFAMGGGVDVGAQVTPKIAVTGTADLGVGLAIPSNAGNSFLLNSLVGPSLLFGSRTSFVSVTPALSFMLRGGDASLGPAIRVGGSLDAMRPYFEVRFHEAAFFGIGLTYGNVTNRPRVRDEW